MWLVSDYLITSNHFDIRISIFVVILQVLEFEFQKFRILENELIPMLIIDAFKHLPFLSWIEVNRHFGK